MGFPSPAADYVERSLNINDLCMTPNSRIIETEDGYAVIDTAKKPVDGCYCYVSTSDGTDFVQCAGGKLVTRDGMVIRGEALDEVTVLGVVTFECIRVMDDASPI